MATPAASAETKGRPPGSARNPSAWRERRPILGLAFVGFCLAGYLAAYQLGIVQSVWEPFFGDGSREVLHSFISRLLPVPDAVLGASGYLAEIVAGLVGGRERWRTMPWIVALSGAIIAAVGITAMVLAGVQLLVIRAGCTLCLTSAAISLVIAWLARHEVFASLRLLKQRHAEQD